MGGANKCYISMMYGHRLVNSQQELPPAVRRGAEIAAARRDKLVAVIKEQKGMYESQREALRAGAISLADLPNLPQPNLMVGDSLLCYVHTKLHTYKHSTYLHSTYLHYIMHPRLCFCLQNKRKKIFTQNVHT